MPALTALPRDEWANIRKEHLLVGKNKDSLRTLETAIFIAILSEETPQTLSEKGKQLLHSDGKRIWFDKSMNLTFFKNGQCGLNAEHSMADGKQKVNIFLYIISCVPVF